MNKNVSKKDRELAIQKALSNNTSKEFRKIEIQGEIIECPIVKIPIEVPIYRMDNGRTTSQQISFLNINKLDTNWFLENKENEEAIEKQHSFLIAEAKTPNENIYEVFKKNKTIDKTRDPILITRDGLIVNGNRRVASLRELFKENPSVYEEFKFIPCQVINVEHIYDSDVKKIERDLQIRKENKAPYKWINQIIMLKEFIDYEKNTHPQLSNKEIYILAAKEFDYEKKTEKEVEKRLIRFDIVEGYLEWSGNPKNYELLNDTQQIVTELANNISKTKGQDIAIRKALSWMGNQILHNRKEFQGRVYDFNHSLKPENVTKFLEISVQHLSGKPIEQIKNEIKKNSTKPIVPIKEGDPFADQYKNQVTPDQMNDQLLKMLEKDIDPKDERKKQKFVNNLTSFNRQIKYAGQQESHFKASTSALDNIELINANWANIPSENERRKIKDNFIKIINIIEKLNKIRTHKPLI